MLSALFLFSVAFGMGLAAALAFVGGPGLALLGLMVAATAVFLCIAAAARSAG